MAGPEKTPGKTLGDRAREVWERMEDFLDAVLPGPMPQPVPVPVRRR